MDGSISGFEPQRRPPTREEIAISQRNSLAAQMLDLQLQQTFLEHELKVARARIAELEGGTI